MFAQMENMMPAPDRPVDITCAWSGGMMPIHGDKPTVSPASAEVDEGGGALMYLAARR